MEEAHGGSNHRFQRRSETALCGAIRFEFTGFSSPPESWTRNCARSWGRREKTPAESLAFSVKLEGHGSSVLHRDYRGLGNCARFRKEPAVCLSGEFAHHTGPKRFELDRSIIFPLPLVIVYLSHRSYTHVMHCLAHGIVGEEAGLGHRANRSLAFVVA